MSYNSSGIYSADNTTLALSASNQFSVKAGGVGASQITSGSITNTQISASAAIALSKLGASTITTLSNTNTLSTASTAAYVMAGLGFTFTPTKSGKVSIVIMTSVGNDTAGDSLNIGGLYYGTGAAPNNGDAATGTLVPGTGGSWREGALGANIPAMITVAAYFNDFANLNTATWLDIQFEAVGGGNAKIGLSSNTVGTVAEFAN